MEQSFVDTLNIQNLLNRTEGDPNVRIAIIDGAIDGQHPDFKNSTFISISHEQQTSGSSAEAKLPSICTNKESPSCQHGTFVAGIIGAARKSPAPGLCPNCTLLVKPIFCEADNLSKCPMVTEADLAKAIHQSINAGAHIINMSVGLIGPQRDLSSELAKAYKRAEEEGVLLVGASGNQSGNEVNSIFKHSWVIPVASMPIQNQPENHTNNNPWLIKYGLLAPGNAILSTAAGGGYQQMTGTSMATPFVSGTLGLLKSLYSEANATMLRRAILQQITTENALQPSISNSIPKFLNADLSESILKNETKLTINEQEIQTMTIQTTEQPDLVAASTPETPSETVTGNTITTAENSNNSSGIQPQECACGGTGGTCSCNTPLQFVYVSGNLRPHFPTEGLKNECNAAAQMLNVSPRDYYSIFTYTDDKGYGPYRYIAEQVSWILSVDNEDVYVLLPNTSYELKEFINTLKTNKQGDQTKEPLSVAIGGLGPMAPKALCPDSPLPLVMCNHTFTYSTASLLKELTGNNTTTMSIRNVLMALTKKPNTGDSDFDRAKNFIAYDYSSLYTRTTDLKSAGDKADENNEFLESFETRYSDSTPGRTVVDIIFTYQKNVSGRQTTYYMSVDVTDQYPFLHSNLTDYIPSN